MAVSKKLFERLYTATNVVVLTGAGISAASGVPTFRGTSGLWKKFKPHELANVEAFLGNPSLVWEWYRWRSQLVAQVEPNTAHFALTELEQHFEDFMVITQNVDNLHYRAGTENIIELHGNLTRNRCIECSKPADEEAIARMDNEQPGEVPTCLSCGNLIRPDVVWFGEMLPQHAIEKAQTLSSQAEVFFSIGTSSTVEPAASLPFLAKGNGAYLVEINTEKTSLTDVCDEHIAAGADEILPGIANVIKKLRSH
ncbi:MAG: SIR2 family NAD-dependent protein deacylase [Calditrichia bacterium]